MQLEYKLPPGMTVETLRQALVTTLKESGKKFNASSSDRERNLAENIGMKFGKSEISNIIPFLIQNIKKECQESTVIWQALEYIRTNKKTGDDILTREASIFLLCHELLFKEEKGKVELFDEIREIFFPNKKDWDSPTDDKRDSLTDNKRDSLTDNKRESLTDDKREKFKKLLFQATVFYCNGCEREILTNQVGYSQYFLERMFFGCDEAGTHKANSGMRRFEYTEDEVTTEKPLATRAYLVAVLAKLAPSESPIISSFRSHRTIGTTLGISGTAIIGTIAVAAVAISIFSGGMVPVIASGIATIASIAYGASAYAIANKASSPEPIDINIKEKITLLDAAANAAATACVIISQTNCSYNAVKNAKKIAIPPVVEAAAKVDPETAAAVIQDAEKEDKANINYKPPLDRLADRFRTQLEKEAEGTANQNLGASR